MAEVKKTATTKTAAAKTTTASKATKPAEKKATTTAAKPAAAKPATKKAAPATKTAAKPIAEKKVETKATATAKKEVTNPQVKAVSAVKSKETAVKTKKINVTFEVYLHDEAAGMKEIYIVGNIPELGEWNPSKSLTLKEKDGKYIGSIKIDPLTVVEYKVCNALNWTGVEKGIWGEELLNHIFHASLDHTEVMGVSRWSME